MKKTAAALIAVLMLIGVTPMQLLAASISLSASKTQVNQNDAFTATVSVNTQGVAINNAEGVISFPASLVSVESVNLNGSIFSIWVEQPSYSNSAGTISFNGGVPNPGYTGSNGTIMRVVFRAKKQGTVSLAFSSADVYANDGLGTNVTSEERPAPPVEVLPKQVEEPKPEAEKPIISITTDVPSAPRITSDQAPDPEAWYSAKSLAFGWELPSGVSKVQLGWGKNALGSPTVTYAPAVKQKTISDIPDGTWYIHARFGNSAGWGAVAHRMFKVDTVAPVNLAVNELPSREGRATLSVKATDELSGVEKYEVSLANSEPRTLAASESTFLFPRMKSGEQTATVRAYDKAGNSTERQIALQIPEVEAPVIVPDFDTIKKGEKISAKGTSYPNTTVRVTIEAPGGKAQSVLVTTDASGAFAYTSGDMTATGTAALSAEVMEGETAVSNQSARVTVSIENSKIVKTSIATINALVYVIPAVALIFILIAGIFLGYYKLCELRRRLRKDVTELKKAAKEHSMSKEEAEAIEKIARDIE